MSTTRSGGRRWAVAASRVVVALGVDAVLRRRRTAAGPPPRAAPPPAVTTVAVRKTDLANTQSFTGTLGFGTPHR